MSGSNRETELTIDLGGEDVQVEYIEADEELGRPFSLMVNVVSPLGEIDILPHLGKSACVTLSHDGELERYFHGILTEGEFLSESPDGLHYRLILKPWTHFLAHNRDFAIYQELDALAIIKKVFEEVGATHVDYTRMSGSYQSREYCVQYAESDFAFISRLMEEEGIYYFFRHDADKHVMMLCDSPSSHRVGTPPSLTYNPLTLSVFNTDSAARSSAGQKFYLQSWLERVASTGEAKVTLRDFDFTRPERPLEQVAENPGSHPSDAVEVYDYPGGYSVESAGRHLGKVTLEAMRAERRSYSGQSQSTALSVGTKVSITEHPAGRFNRSYLITRTRHSVTSESYRTGARQEQEESYNVVIEAVPDDTRWRSVQLSPRPIVHGLESAIVTGPSGEEIFTDEYGRVKVRFHWDRSGSPGEKTTCWMRVSQTGGLGNIILPRVGHEVLVDFLGGDPDSPVVVGRVFNRAHMPIYPLPANKTIALWRTKRYRETGSYAGAKSLDTGAPGANELRFEDKGGVEEVFLHAERDMNTRIRLDETHHVGRNQGIDIGGNQTEEILKDRKTTIKSTDSLDVTKSIKIKAGTTIDIEAGTSITLKVGQTTIKMDGTSIKLNTTMFDTKASATATVKSPMTTIKGDGTLTLKGGMTFIN